MKTSTKILIGTILAALVVAVSVFSCATGPCKPAVQVMSEKNLGTVLECYKFRAPDTNEMEMQCLILTRRGIIKRYVTGRYCEQEK